MKSLRISPVVFAVLFCFGFSHEASAVIDPQAPVVKLRTTCQEGAVTLDNCFTTMTNVLTWTYGTRHPNVSLPLLVDIGPGSFGGFTCDGSGYITLRGAGRNNTVLLGTTVVGLPSGGSGPGCTQLVFQDLSIVGGIQWWGSGSASYTNIDLSARGFAWWDIRFGAATPSQHYWWNCVFNSTSGSGEATFQAYGSVHRFFGGEVNLSATADDAQAVHVNAAGGTPGEIQMYGSAIRVHVTPGATVTKLTGVTVDVGQTFHLHGSTIGVDATAAGGANVGVVGINSANGSTVHVVDVAYNLKPSGTGRSTRLNGTAGPGLTAPFWWGTGATPPAITSLDGYDLFVQTNCSSGGCQTSGTEPHMLIYSSNCTGSGGPWFDVVTRSCR